ncbi:MAG: hypothetical protein ACR2QM_01580 [Longimicrobiales bacterium]
MDEAQRWARVEEIFHLALERPPEERGAFLTRICAGDRSLEERVRALLAAEHESGDFMDVPAARVSEIPAARLSKRDVAGSEGGQGQAEGDGGTR